jgi:hypothetical protein
MVDPMFKRGMAFITSAVLLDSERRSMVTEPVCFEYVAAELCRSGTEKKDLKHAYKNQKIHLF